MRRRAPYELAILSRNKGLHSTQRFVHEAKRRGIRCQIINPLECEIIVQRKKIAILLGTEPVPHFDAVLPRIGTSITDYGIAVVRQFEAMDIYSVNRAESIAQSRDKFTCLQILNEHGIPVPTTVLARSQRGLKQALHALGGMPVVVKLIKGTQGVGVMLLNSQASLKSVLDTFWNLEQDVLIQEFITEGAGQDYRVLVVGNEVVASMIRTAPKGDFRSNIHRGGLGIPVKLPRSYARVAIRAAQVLGLELAGVDLMEGKNGPVVLEVNSSPGFEGIERATGVNVAGKIVDHILKRIRARKR